MTDTSKLNNYHFGRHVFDYFPWYTYDKDINIVPTLNDTIRRDFNFALDSDSMIYVWNGYFVTLDSSRFDPDRSVSLYIENGVASYCGIKETVNDWEDIEKIRLRNILGTKEKAEKYLKIIDNYQMYHDLISDMVYTQAGEEIEVSVVSLGNLASGDPESYLSFVEDEDVIKVLKQNHSSNFLSSVYSYFCKNGKLTVRQIEAVKKTLSQKLLLDILKSKKTFFYVKTSRIPNIDRVINYLTEVELSCKKFNDYILIYK